MAKIVTVGECRDGTVTFDDLLKINALLDARQAAEMAEYKK